MDTISWSDFLKVELRVGRVLEGDAVVLCVPERDVPLGTKLL